MQATGIKGSVETLLDEADTDGDGRISLPEFQSLLHQASFGSRTNSDHTKQHKWPEMVTDEQTDEVRR